MKFMWGKKEFTIMIIPGANHRIVRIKLPQSSLIVVPSVVLLVLISFIYTIYSMNSHFHRTTTALKQSYDGQERQLSDQIVAKDSELEHLQSNLVDLSAQAEQFKAKLEEIKKLQNVLNTVTQTTLIDKNSAKPTPTPPDPTPNNTKRHVGGTDAPVAEQQVTQLVSQTRTNLTLLVGDINELLGSLSQSEIKLQQIQHLKNITPTIWPTFSHTITSGFGIRMDPFTQKPSMHTGLDIVGNLNDPVYSAAEGKVLLAEWDSQYGNHIVIDHSAGLQTEYLHLNKMLVGKGDSVSKGQKIGLVGTTGRSTGTHLHYEVHKNNIQVDPTPYLITDRKEVK